MMLSNPSVLSRRRKSGADAQLAAEAARPGRGAVEEDGFEHPYCWAYSSRGQAELDWLQTRLDLDDAR